MAGRAIAMTCALAMGASLLVALPRQAWAQVEGDQPLASRETMPGNPAVGLPRHIAPTIADDDQLVADGYAADGDGNLIDIKTGQTVSDPALVGTATSQPDPLAKSRGRSFTPVSAGEVRRAMSGRRGGQGLTRGLPGNQHGAHWGTYKGLKAFFQGGKYGDAVFAVQAGMVIDVSEWQGAVDWGKVKKAGVDGAIIRLGFGWNNRLDSQAERNIKECRRLGIPFGIYWYSYARNGRDAQKEADEAVSQLSRKGLGPAQLAYPFFYDLEPFQWAGNRHPSKPGEYETIVRTFFSGMQAAGYRDLSVYSYPDYLGSNLKSRYIHDRTRWVASYGPTPLFDFKDNYRGWQYTSTGVIPGISGRNGEVTQVDLNAFGNARPTNVEILDPSGKWMWMDGDGKPAHGFIALPDGRRVYYAADGGMVHGEARIGGYWYFFDRVDGHMARDEDVFLREGRKWVHYDPSGHMVYGERCLRGGWYWFDPVTGAMSHDWQWVPSNGGKWVHYDRVTGRMQYGEQCIRGHWYLLERVTGARATGWRHLDSNGGKTVYYDRQGRMLKGRHVIDGRTYEFDLITGALKS